MFKCLAKGEAGCLPENVLYTMMEVKHPRRRTSRAARAGAALRSMNEVAHRPSVEHETSVVDSGNEPFKANAALMLWCPDAPHSLLFSSLGFSSPNYYGPGQMGKYRPACEVQEVLQFQGTNRLGCLERAQDPERKPPKNEVDEGHIFENVPQSTPLPRFFHLVPC